MLRLRRRLRPPTNELASDAERSLRAALEGAYVGTWEWQAPGRLLYFNHWASMLGYEPGAGVPPLHSVLHPEERRAVLARLAGFVRGASDFFEMEHRILARSGGWRWMLTRGRALERNPRGRLLRAVGVYVDVTEHRFAGLALQESEERYRALVDSASDAIYVVDRAGVVRFANRHAAEQHGGAPEELVGRALSELLPPEVAREQLARIDEVIRTARPMEADTTIVGDGEPRIYHTILQPLRRAGGRPAVLVAARDITALRRSEERLKELNNALAARASQLRTLAMQLTRAEQRERQRVSEILHDHVQQMLAAAKLRLGLLHGRVTGEEGNTLLAKAMELVCDSIAAVRSLAVELSPPALKDSSLTAALGWLADQAGKKHGLKVRLEAEAGLEAPSEEVRVFLYQAVRELLFNVFKYARVDRAVIRASSQDGSVRLAVEDSGVGFEATAATRQGLGLFGIRERVEALGGTMRIDAAPGRGTRVTLTVPVSPPVR